MLAGDSNENSSPAASGRTPIRMRTIDLQPIASLAASVFDVPVAHVSLLVGDRLVHQGAVGLEVGSSVEQSSLFGAVMRPDEDMLLVGDLRESAEFRDAPEVIGASGRRFLAQVKLRLDHHLVGVLGVLGDSPREVLESHRRQLDHLARAAQALLAANATYPHADDEAHSEMVGPSLRDGAQQLTQFTLDNVESDVLWVRQDGTISYVNDAFCRRIGYGREELLQKKPHDLDPEFTPQRVGEIFQRVKHHGSMTFDTHPQRKNGEHYDSLVTVSFMKQGDDEFLCVIGQDITDRKRVEGELRRMKHAIDHFSDAAYWIDQQGGIRYANHTAAQRLGYSRAALTGMSVWDIDHSLDAEAWKELWSDALEQSGLAFETQHRRRDGMERTCDVRITRMTFAGDELVFATARDITQQRQQGEELGRMRVRLQAALMGGQIGLWDWNIKTNEVYVSPELNAQLGEAADSWNDISDFEKRLHPEDVEPAGKEISDYLEGRKADYENVFRLRHLAGGFRWILSRGKLFRDENGNPVRFLGTHVDITDRKHDEARLAKDLIRSGSLLRASREIMAVSSLGELAASVTQRARGLIGAHQAVVAIRRGEQWSDAESGVSMSERYPRAVSWNQPAADAGLYQVVCRGNRPVVLTESELQADMGWKRLRDSGAPCPANGWLAAPLVDRHGRNLGLIQLSDRFDGEFESDDADLLVQFAYIVSIVTDRLQAEEIVRVRSEQLQAALTETQETSVALRRSNQELERFAYVASHDLRSPLRGISNLVSWVSEDCKEAGVALPDSVQQHLDMLTRQVQRMDGLLTGLLEYSRAGRIHYAPERLDLGELIDEVVSMVGAPKGFQINRPANLPIILGERSPLERVFLNLIANAVKHHDQEQGRVEIELEDAGDFCRFLVSDDGPGIPAEHHDRVFEIYQTLRTKDQVEGSGIGLSIVKKLVESNGGVIHVARSDKRGTTFVFTWPKVAKKESGSAK